MKAMGWDGGEWGGMMQKLPFRALNAIANVGESAHESQSQGCLGP